MGTDTIAIDSIISQAFNIVESNGRKYNPLLGVYYLIDEKGNESDNHNCYDYCYKCATKVANKIGLFIQQESCPEKDDFCICEGCGKIIETSIIWSRSEMDHWIDNLEKSDLKKRQICYELMKVLDPNYGAFNKYPELVCEIAKKVVSFRLTP